MNLVALLAALKVYMDAFFGVVRNQLTTIVSRFNDHQQDEDNPHGVTADQLGLDMVENFPPATKQEAEDGIINTSVMTPKRTAQFADKQIFEPLAQIFEQATNDLNS